MSEQKVSPANPFGFPEVTEENRVPLLSKGSRLAVPEIPGYHLHWAIGTVARLQELWMSGYVFVEPDEVMLSNQTLGSDPMADGNTDLGTRVSQLAGSEVGADGQPVRLYLMKKKEEWWQRDQQALTGPGSRLDDIRTSLVGGLLGSEGQSKADRAQTYVDKSRTKIPEFFTRKS